MHIYRLERQQYINSDISTVWAFFSSPANLALITPPELNFKTTSPQVSGPIFAGQLITYTITPVLGIPLAWETEITCVREKDFFVDEQKKGPYKLWRHKHTFVKQGDGVMMTDEVEYALPLSLLGRIAHCLFIKKKLEHIFGFRYRQTESLFNKK